jgi:hypothetical protein
MASVSVDKAGGARTGALLFACVAEHGSAAHPWFGGGALLAGPDSARDLADAIHFLATLHGRLPGLIELAGLRSIEPAARAWLNEAAEAMATERHYLTRLAVAAGPVPGTPGGAASEGAVIAQRGAISTLAQSDRRGCALGAALAFAADWAPVRALLDSAARRLGLDVIPGGLGDPAALLTIADECGTANPAVSRAMLFGAQQLALQHHGLWDLLHARHQARMEA